MVTLAVAGLLCWSALPARSADVDVSYDYGHGLIAAEKGSTLVLVSSTTAGDDLPDSVLKITAQGVLDTTFGSGGVARLPDNTQVQAMTRYRNGRILVGGMIGYRNWFLLRLTADGNPDPTFGAGGQRTYDLDYMNGLRSLAVLPNGAIVGLMSAFTGGFTTPLVRQFYVAKVSAAGEPDLSFGTDGKAPIPSGEMVQLTVTPDSKILTTGRDGGNHPCLVRYNSDGTLDSTFGSGGAVTLDLSGVTLKQTLPQKDGGYLVSGLRFEASSSSVVVLKLDHQGVLDPSFGLDGVASYAPGAWAMELDFNSSTLLADGSIQIGAIVLQLEPVQMPVGHILQVRFTSQGTLDTDYAQEGVWISVPLPHSHSGRWLTQALYVVPRGAGCVALVDDGGTANPDIKVMRFGPKGYKLYSFGTKGVFAWDFTP
jgi:uncharacterized delta-60 repeat protein